MKLSSIEDLRRTLEEQRATTGRQRIGDKALGVLSDLLDRPGAAAVGSISALAAQNEVDPSTLTRLGKRLGLSGFSELQDIFRQHVEQTQPFYSTRVQERISEPLHADSESLQRQHARTECQKLMSTVESMDPDLIEKAADLLVSAKHVYVLGLRATYALSFFLGTYLGTFRQNVTILGGPGFALASDIARISEDDLLVAISYRPYTKAVITAVDITKENRIPVLALTDTNSPLAVAPHQGLTVAIDAPFYFDSATAHFFIIQTILLSAARRLGESAVQIAQRREQLYRALDIEVY